MKPLDILGRTLATIAIWLAIVLLYVLMIVGTILLICTFFGIIVILEFNDSNRLDPSLPLEKAAELTRGLWDLDGVQGRKKRREDLEIRDQELALEERALSIRERDNALVDRILEQR